VVKVRVDGDEGGGYDASAGDTISITLFNSSFLYLIAKEDVLVAE
jgi:hypothetical protein